MGKEENVIATKSYAFAVRIVRLYQYLSKEKQEYVLSKQFLRSGTSIGANVEEGIGAQSERDFYTKLRIAYKETRETHFWLRLLRDTNYITDQGFDSIMPDCEELQKILGAIFKTYQQKLKPQQ